MSTTIFCTFEQTDIADLAMGHIRGIPGVLSIHYIVERRPEPRGGAVNAVIPLGIPVELAGHRTEQSDPRPAKVKITCNDRARRQVVASLVNLHAHQIVTTP